MIAAIRIAHAVMHRLTDRISRQLKIMAINPVWECDGGWTFELHGYRGGVYPTEREAWAGLWERLGDANSGLAPSPDPEHPEAPPS